LHPSLSGSGEGGGGAHKTVLQPGAEFPFAPAGGVRAVTELQARFSAGLRPIPPVTCASGVTASKSPEPKVFCGL
jgi:hypothetical protein